MLSVITALLVIAARMIAPAESLAIGREAGRTGQSRDGKKKNDAVRMAERLRKPGKRDSIPPPHTSRRQNKPATTAPKTQGRLAVITGLVDANVTIKRGGEVLQSGRSQNGRFEAELPAGEYDVEVESEEKTVYFRKAIVTRAQTQTLTTGQSKAEPKKTGAIIVEMGEIAPDVVVLVDGQRPASVTAMSETQVRLDNIAYGNHRLHFSHASIKDLDLMVEVAAASISINPAFEVIAGKLIIRSEPGADIYIDGKREGKVAESGEIALYAAPGQRTIKAQKDGYLTSEYNGLVGLETVVINLKLARKKH
jgi:hypothetical protein